LCGSGRDRDKVLDEIGTRGERDDSNEVRRRGSKARATMETRTTIETRYEGLRDSGAVAETKTRLRRRTGGKLDCVFQSNYHKYI